nr:hypothetical protein [Tanacetum cinerariifolium]
MEAKESNDVLGDKIKKIDGKGMRTGILRLALRGMPLNQPGTFVTSTDGTVRQVVNQHIQPNNVTEKNASSSGIRSCSDEIFGGATLGSQHGMINRSGNSFAFVIQAKTNKKVVKIKELRNEAVVEGAAVAIPFEAVEEVKSRFSNTLYGFFIGKRLAFPLVENYVKNTWAKYGLKRVQLHDDFFLFQFGSKEGMGRVLEDGPWLICTVPLILNVWSPNAELKKAKVKKASVWIKVHHVPIVAYSDIGLSLITTQLGKPITLDSYTSTMCLSSWGKSTYARALIEVSAEKELLDSLVIAIPVDKDKGHTLAMIDIEYEWNPPRYATCLIFDHHTNKCPKLPKTASVKNVDGDGRVEKGDSSKKVHIDTSQIPELSVSNSFGLLDDDKGPYEDSSLRNKDVLNLSDDDIDEEIHVGRDGKSTASSSTVDIALYDFRECVEEMEVSDIQCTRLYFTWNQKPRGGHGILKKLDRIMANSEFHDYFVGAHAIFKSYRVSNHSPSILCIPTMSKTNPKTFKFFNILTSHEKFLDMVKAEWDHYISGFHMHRVVKKLKNLKKPFRKLLYKKGDLQANVTRLRNDPNAVQTSLDTDPFNVALREKEATCIVEFNNAVLMEERFLKQKAKIQWLKEGDSNSAYFHKAVKSRVSRCRIDVITNSEGIIFENDMMPNAFVEHYELFLGQAGNVDHFNSTNLFKVRLNEHDALDMVRDVSNQEVKNAIFSMGDDKSLGLDGFTVVFFKEAWNVIAIDVTHAVPEFFRNAFVPGRSITDNILLTQELMHNYHVDRGSPRKVQDTDSFSYHRIIKEALDEFKNASGLAPCLPKSTTFFCNVLNHVKLSILQVLLFEEGTLPVKYLGVPLVSSRLMIRDCNELIDKVKIRIQDWKNKALSIAEPIGCLVSHRDMARAGLTPNSKVHDVIIEGTWLWSHDLIAKFPVLNDYNVPINYEEVDRLVWRDSYVRRKLKTQDLIPVWDVSSSLGVVCSLCESNPDSHDHLFFECPVACGIWNRVKGLAGLNASNSNIYDIIQDLLLIVKRRTMVSVIAKLVVAASAYYGWQKRNRRLFKKGKRNSDQIVECIVSSMRLKLLSCKLKKSKSGERMARLWDLHEVVFI